MKGRSVSLINPSRANDDQQDEQHNNKRKSSAEIITISHNDTASFFISSDYNGILCIKALIGMGESTVFLILPAASWPKLYWTRALSCLILKGSR